MKLVFAVKPDKKASAESIVRSDDLISRQSITIRSSESIGMGKRFENCYFLLIDGSEEAVQKSRDLLKDVAEKLDDKEAEEVSEKIKAEEDRAIEGFGNVIGF